MVFRLPRWSGREGPDDCHRREPDADEADHVSAAREDPRAFTTLYARYLQPVYGYCYVRLGSREAAEDATGETFMKALAALPSFRDGTFAAWLFRIAHNVVVDLQGGRRPTAPLDAAEPRDEDPTPEEVVVASAEAAALRAALARLSPEQRAVLELQLAGWSQRDVAAALGKSEAAVKMLRLRAVARLRTLLAINQETAPREVHDA